MIPFDRRPAHEAPLEKGGPGASSALDRPHAGAAVPVASGDVAAACLDRGRDGAVANDRRAAPSSSTNGEPSRRSVDAGACRRSPGCPRSGGAAGRSRRSRAMARLPGPRPRRGRAARGGGALVRRRRRAEARGRGMAREPRPVGSRCRRAQPIASMSDVESQEASYVLVRTGVLKARAGEAARRGCRLRRRGPPSTRATRCPRSSSGPWLAGTRTPFPRRTARRPMSKPRAAVRPPHKTTRSSKTSGALSPPNRRATPSPTRSAWPSKRDADRRRPKRPTALARGRSRLGIARRLPRETPGSPRAPRPRRGRSGRRPSSSARRSITRWIARSAGPKGTPSTRC